MSEEPSPKLKAWVNVPTISMAALGLSFMALIAAVCMYVKDGTSAPLIGAIGLLLGKGGTVIDYWLGSSSGSQRKDAVIADQLPPPTKP